MQKKCWGALHLSRHLPPSRAQDTFLLLLPTFILQNKISTHLLGCKLQYCCERRALRDTQSAAKQKSLTGQIWEVFIYFLCSNNFLHHACCRIKYRWGFFCIILAESGGFFIPHRKHKTHFNIPGMAPISVRRGRTSEFCWNKEHYRVRHKTARKVIGKEIKCLRQQTTSKNRTITVSTFSLKKDVCKLFWGLL